MGRHGPRSDERPYLNFLIAVTAYMRYAVLAAMLILTACGNSPAPLAQVSHTPSPSQASPRASPNALPSASPSPSPKASPTPKPEFLFAVLESSSTFGQPGTVAIVGLDGHARSKTTFQPRTNPGAILQSTAQVVGSWVYYIDANGTVRVIRAHTSPQVVASFPSAIGPHDIWFAVSPDGSHLLAGVLTFSSVQPISKFDLEAANAGGQWKVLVHSQFASDTNGPTTFPVGRTSTGPVAMVGSLLTTQNSWPGGLLYDISNAGQKTKQVGGSGCYSDTITPSGLIPCSSSGVLTIRDSLGKLVWTPQIDGSYAPSLHISPDGQSISNQVQAERHGGKVAQMQSAFQIQGWLDSNTVVGRLQYQNGSKGDLSWISVSQPTKLHDLGFKGDFVATLA